jgi:hypothetical protein
VTDARTLADTLRAAQRAASMNADMERSIMLGDYASLCERYARRFKKWSEEAVPYPDKSRALRAFASLQDACRAELAP